MRSAPRPAPDDVGLPFDLPPERARPVPATATDVAVPDPEPLAWYRVEGTEFTSRGWPAGTELLIDVNRTPQRGDVVLARHGGMLRAGELSHEVGRLAVRSDHGSIWLESAAQVVGVVRVAEPPLHGMPVSPARRQ